MYDYYSEVECLDTSKSMTRDEYTEFVIQRSLFLDKLKAEVARYDKIISKIDSLDSELVQAYSYKRHKVLALSKIPIESPEELEFYKWVYNGGKVRSKEEVEEAHEAIMEEKCRQMDMEFRRSADYHFQKTIFMILVILAVWFLPGWLFPSHPNDFHFGATLTNLVVLFFLHPVQLLLTLVAFCSDGFVRLGTKDEDNTGVRSAATAAGVSSVMQARTMSKVGKSLMSGRKKI